MGYSVTIPLRWNDLDAQGHVNNVVYLDFLQEARVEFLSSSAAASLLAEGVVVTAHQVEYLRPVEYAPDPVEVELAIASVGGARFEVAYALRDHGQLALRARTVCCPFDFAARAPRRLRDEERRALEAELAPVEALASLPTAPLGGGGFVAPLKVRWSDQDRYRHVNNVRFFDFFQDARLRLLLEADPAETLEQRRLMWYIARHDVRYRAQLDYRREPYCIRTGVTRIGTSSLTLRSEVRASADPAAAVIAESDCVMVAGDLQTGRPTPVPDDMRARLQTYAAQ